MQAAQDPARATYMLLAKSAKLTQENAPQLFHYLYPKSRSEGAGALGAGTAEGGAPVEARGAIHG